MNRISVLLEAISTCLCQKIGEAEGPGVCFCGVMPGDHVIPAYTGDCSDVCGMAYVRVLQMYPAVGVGVPSTELRNCGAQLGLEIEVGILRCMTVGDAQGNPPEEAELLEASNLQMADSLTMMRAFDCCDALHSRDYRIGNYVPTGPRGGIHGGSWQVSVVV